MQRRLEKLVAQFDESDIPNEPDDARRYRLTTQAFVRRYAEYVEVTEQEWIAKQVQTHLMELHKDKAEYFRARRKEIRVALRHGLRSISLTREWWTTWRPFWLAGQALVACFAVWVMTLFLPMANGAGKALESRCIRRLLVLLPQAQAST